LWGFDEFRFVKTPFYLNRNIPMKVNYSGKLIFFYEECQVLQRDIGEVQEQE
jgi:hypothetical protein